MTNTLLKLAEPQTWPAPVVEILEKHYELFLGREAVAVAETAHAAPHSHSEA